MRPKQFELLAPAEGTYRIALVGCGASKVDHVAMARDLYTGNLFRATRRHVEDRYDAWWILSAKHGALAPCTVIRPYDRTIADLTVDELHAWTNRVDSRVRLDAGLGLWSQQGGRVEVDLFAGKPYCDPVLERWSALPWMIHQPLEGLQIGERLHWFAEQAVAA